MRLGQQVANIRAKRGLTQEALAARMGVCQTRISELERGIRNLNHRDTTRLLAALNCTFEELEGQESKTLTAAEHLLIDNFRAMTALNQESFIKIGEVLR